MVLLSAHVASSGVVTVVALNAGDVEVALPSAKWGGDKRANLRHLSQTWAGGESDKVEGQRMDVPVAF